METSFSYALFPSLFYIKFRSASFVYNCNLNDEFSKEASSGGIFNPKTPQDKTLKTERSEIFPFRLITPLTRQHYSNTPFSHQSIRARQAAAESFIKFFRITTATGRINIFFQFFSCFRIKGIAGFFKGLERI